MKIEYADGVSDPGPDGGYVYEIDTGANDDPENNPNIAFKYIGRKDGPLDDSYTGSIKFNRAAFLDSCRENNPVLKVIASFKNTSDVALYEKQLTKERDAVKSPLYFNAKEGGGPAAKNLDSSAAIDLYCAYIDYKDCFEHGVCFVLCARDVGILV